VVSRENQDATARRAATAWSTLTVSCLACPGIDDETDSIGSGPLGHPPPRVDDLDQARRPRRCRAIRLRSRGGPAGERRKLRRNGGCPRIDDDGRELRDGRIARAFERTHVEGDIDGTQGSDGGAHGSYGSRFGSGRPRIRNFANGQALVARWFTRREPRICAVGRSPPRIDHQRRLCERDAPEPDGGDGQRE
jgi:hypothetical protein